MCDYSLEAYQSRPAAIGEKLTLERFPSGSMGFASGKSCDLAVCVAADAQLRLEGIGEPYERVRHRTDRRVVMTRPEGGPTRTPSIPMERSPLQRLDCGLTAVLVASDPTDRHPLLAAPAVREPELV
jgi:hypothetical protein